MFMLHSCPPQNNCMFNFLTPKQIGIMSRYWCQAKPYLCFVFFLWQMKPMCFCLQWRAKVPPQKKSIRLQTSENKIIYRRRSLSNHVSRRSCNLSSCFMEIKCQNWITGFHQSLSSDLALGLLTFMQSWRQTVFGDWCKIAPGAGAAANQRRCKIAGILIRSSCVAPCWHCAGWEGWGWGDGWVRGEVGGGEQWGKRQNSE